MSSGFVDRIITAFHLIAFFDLALEVVSRPESHLAFATSKRSPD